MRWYTNPERINEHVLTLLEHEVRKEEEKMILAVQKLGGLRAEKEFVTELRKTEPDWNMDGLESRIAAVFRRLEEAKDDVADAKAVLVHVKAKLES